MPNDGGTLGPCIGKYSGGVRRDPGVSGYQTGGTMPPAGESGRSLWHLSGGPQRVSKVRHLGGTSCGEMVVAVCKIDPEGV